MKVRRFVIKCINEEVCYELLHKISEEVSARWIKGEVDGNKLLIEALGFPYELKELRYEIEELKKEIESAMLPYTRVSVDELPKLTKAAVPIDALVEALKLLGYSAKVEGRTLVSDAPFEEVAALARKMKEIIDSEIVRFRLPHSMKKAVAVLSTVYGVNPEEVVNVMLREGLLEEGDFKYEQREEWRKVIKRVSERLSEEW
ncbi:DUF2067 domain-containing protein [Ignicoccus hospitalis]|uniref:Uncharacterized protein-like protein n=1 Tax=Ignicoccus hospitalis (strain KIN4/I / DSM 18386 / JCM 14125) TaxID=453591 RepID=A8AA06_IGNH4|nr:DUF2067 domain-containing protein [Ignicoccus hospitalis]ABU81758.1 Uncharacterized protein-like protein [Ignicoccus hospitalis KIN4/I]HIH90026.1 DUF2067 domain-containing protein [Desulfurococcaceae archaeon]